MVELPLGGLILCIYLAACSLDKPFRQFLPKSSTISLKHPKPPLLSPLPFSSPHTSITMTVQVINATIALQAAEVAAVVVDKIASRISAQGAQLASIPPGTDKPTIYRSNILRAQQSAVSYPIVGEHFVAKSKVIVDKPKHARALSIPAEGRLHDPSDPTLEYAYPSASSATVASSTRYLHSPRHWGKSSTRRRSMAELRGRLPGNTTCGCIVGAVCICSGVGIIWNLIIMKMQ